MAHLCSLTNSKGIYALQFEDEQFVVGRHPECSLVIDLASISRHHAAFLFDGHDYYLRDLKSRNKTFLNGVEIDPNEPPPKLNDEDKISFCDLEYIFRTSDPPPRQDIEFVEDQETPNSSTVMLKLGVPSESSSAQLAAGPDARLKALLEINRSLGGALALDEVLPQVLNSLFKIFVQADRGFVALNGPDGTLELRWTHTRHEREAETIRVSRTIVNKVMASREGMLLDDAMMDEEFSKAQSVADFRIRSVMCVPLIDSEGRSMGVLQVDTVRRAKRFQEEDLGVLLAVASQAGIAIDNARMHDAALQQRVLERDLELAREVQNGFLPEHPPQVAGYEFYDFYRPANQIGGDYYDYAQLPGGQIAVIVADVVGKGVAAALLMAKLSAETRFCLASAAEAGQAMTMLNDRLCRLHLDKFVTAVIVLIDPAEHMAYIANAGHMPPILRWRDGSVIEPSTQEAGLPLGIEEDIQYGTATVPLHPGGSITLYTDGLNEAVSEAHENYSIARIRNRVKAVGGPPNKLGPAIISDVREFVGNASQSDDMCLVVLGRAGEDDPAAKRQR